MVEVKRYAVLRKTVLGFAGGQEQYDAWVLPGDVLETDQQTIWLVNSEGRRESTTQPHLVDVLLKDGGYLEEIV